VKSTIVYLPSVLRAASRLTDNPEEARVLGLECALRFLIGHPADEMILAGPGHRPDQSIVTCLGDPPPEEVGWTIYQPTGGLGWAKEWSAADAGIFGQAEDECRAMVQEGIDRDLAAKILRKYNTLEAAIDDLDKIKPKYLRPLLGDAWQRAAVNGERSPVDTSISFEYLPSFFHRYKEEIARLREEASTTKYICVQDEEALQAMVKDLSSASWLAVDTETSSLDPFTLDIAGLSLSQDGIRAYYVPVGHETDERQLPIDLMARTLAPLLLEKPLVFHNASFDLRVLAKLLGVSWRLFKVHGDTQLSAFVCGLGKGTERGTLGLKQLVLRLLGIAMTSIEELIGSQKARQIPFTLVPIWKAKDYAAEDAAMTARLFVFLEHLVRELGVANTLELELRYLPIVVEMEESGTSIDLSLIDEIGDDLDRDITALEIEIEQMIGEVDLNSPEKLSHKLYDELGLPPGKRTQKAYSTEKQHLDSISELHPAVDKILEYRALSKLKSTYVTNLQDHIHPITDRTHSSWNQAGAESGRLSCSAGPTGGVNIQQIPKRGERGAAIRKAFMAASNDYDLVGGDLGQIEMRITAHITEDKNMIADFLSGEDFHRRTASRMFGRPPEQISDDERDSGKTLNFGVNYGLSPAGAQRFHMTQQRLKEMIDLYYSSYPRVRPWQKETIRKARQIGYAETMFGRKRWFHHINDASAKIRSGEERAATNFPIQGMAADLIKMAMINLDFEIELRGWRPLVKCLMQVHDEVIYEAHNSISEELRYVMDKVFTTVATLRVPIVFESHIARSWAELKVKAT